MSLFIVAARVGRVARRGPLLAGLALCALVVGSEGAWAAAPLELSARITEAAPVPGAKFTGVAAGDVNGDGKDDVVVWRPGAGAGTPPAAGAGALWVVYGTSPTRDATVPPAAGAGFQIKGPGTTPVLGAKRLGDFDGDGKDDLIVFAADRIYVVFGESGGATVTLGSGDRSLAIANGISSVTPAQGFAAGDFNGDGKADVLVNRARPPRLLWTQQTGAAVLFGGPRVASYDVRNPSSRVATINGGVSCTWYGVCGESIQLPTSVGDVNGDGYDDLVNQLNNAPYITLGRPGAPELRAGSPDAQSIRFTLPTGYKLSEMEIGDLTGDGIDDIPVGRFVAPAGPNLYVVPGRRTGPTTIDVANTPTIKVGDPSVEPGGLTPRAWPAGDLDGDGADELVSTVFNPGQEFAELLVPTIPAAPGTAVNATAPRYPGPPTRIYDPIPAGDLDGDGQGDLVFSAPLHDTGGAEDSGAVFIATHQAGGGPGPEPEPDPEPEPEPQDPSFAGWTPSGTATVLPDGGGVQLTNATATRQAGAIYDTRRKIDANRLTVEFDATLEGGTGQGNGLTLALASESQGGKAIVRDPDVSLGWVPNKGAAIVLGTVASTATPGNSYTGVTVAPARYGHPALLSGTRIQPPLAGRTSHVKVQAKDGTVTVWIDGLHAFHRAMTLPNDAWLGFTASTGAKTQRHVVKNLEISLD